MKNSNIKWLSADPTLSVQLTAAMYKSNAIHSFPIEILPIGIQKMRGIQSAFVCRSPDYYIISATLSAFAEFAVTRIDGLTAKGYNYPIALSADGSIVYGPQVKWFKGHHWYNIEITHGEFLFGHGIKYIKENNMH